mgnify:CR=1 FL=1
MGSEPVDDWIRLFNAEREEDLEIIEAKNTGIREAIMAMKEMGLRKNLRYLYEDHIKLTTICPAALTAKGRTVK